MRLDKDCVLHVKSASPYFVVELYGDKPNTVRVVNDDEFDMCCDAVRIMVHPVGDDIEHFDPFTRAIIGVYDITDVIPVKLPSDKKLLLIAWEEDQWEEEAKS